MKFKKVKKIKKKSKILVKAKLIAQQVLNNFKEYQNLSLQDLQIRTNYLIDGLQKNKFTLDDIVVDAFSIAREIIYREHGLLAFEVQMMGAYVVHCGDFSEMYTGEGKTLTILLVSFLNALEKKGVHIVTVNEYLVERDAEFANKAFEKLGISVGYNTSKLNKDVKKQMFAKDITYTTNSELGFDYLKDNMVRSIEEKVIRELNFVIVDEADSVLIDEARTPLIISGQPKEDFSLYLEVDNFVSSLVPDDYVIDNESNTIALSDSGVAKAERFFKLNNLYSVESAEIVHKITNSLIAHYIFANGKEYLVKDGIIYLVDQFTGRILEGRSYNAGLQQAIQSKERVKIEPENVIMATITYQSFFRLYKKLSGVSGTAMTEAEEFLKIYNMVVVRIPTNKPIQRIDKQDYIFGNKKAKWNHVIAEIQRRHEVGQPILVGTASVTDSEIIHERLNELNIAHEVLNARDNTKEAEIVKHAGEKGAITISTNMAGRGTDIKVNDEVRKLGGLYVIGTERHESRRVDNQLRGRTGRQGDPGESRFFTSLEDSLFKRFATDRFEKASQKLEDEFYDFKFFSKMLDRTQKKVEGLNFDIRKNLMDYDHVLSLQRELVYKQRDQILLKTNNFEIINNMINDFVRFEITSYKNVDNTSLIDANKFTNFLNERILKFDYFDPALFANMSISLAAEKGIEILQKIVAVKYKILESINALNVIDEILIVNLDSKWTRHIDKMTKLREGVNLRSLEQRSPLNIYIEDGNNLFEKMKIDVVNDTIAALCNLSLPNESNELREALDSLVNSSDFKKKEFSSLKKVEQSYFDDISTNVSEFENFMIDETVDKPKPITPQIVDNSQPLEIIDDHNQVIELSNSGIPIVNNIQSAKSDLYKLNHNTSDVNVLDQKSLIEKQSLDAILDAVDEQEKEFTTHEEVEPLLNFDENTNDIQLTNPFALEEELEDQDTNVEFSEKNNEIPIASEIESVNKDNSEAEVNESIEPIDSDPKMSEDEIEAILSQPAFKEGEQPVSLGQFLDTVLQEMDYEPDTQDEDEAQEIEDSEAIEKAIEENPDLIDLLDSDVIKEFINNTATQESKPENDLQDLDDDKEEDETDEEISKQEIKKAVVSDLFLDTDFQKYKNSVFSQKKNEIDYQDVKNSIQQKSDAEIDKMINPFYKLPVVEKKAPGTLFGGRMPDNSPFKFQPNIVSKKNDALDKELNQASQSQLNDLLILDDEQERLDKIAYQQQNKDADYLLEQELKKQIEDESPNIEELHSDSKIIIEPTDTKADIGLNNGIDLKKLFNEPIEMIQSIIKNKKLYLDDVEKNKILVSNSEAIKEIQEKNESLQKANDENNKSEENDSALLAEEDKQAKSEKPIQQISNLQKDVIEYLEETNKTFK
ncbi:MAG: preprotein translocase subunit SecA [Malacoplasma sp.]|nr:preprotein translocase subunit SecA [Malacoplasma sp.]